MLRIRTGESRRKALLKSLLNMERSALHERQVIQEQQRLRNGNKGRLMVPPQERIQQQQQQQQQNFKQNKIQQKPTFSPSITKSILEQLSGNVVEMDTITPRDGKPEPRRCQRMGFLIQNALSMALIEQRIPLLMDEHNGGVSLEIVDVRMTTDLRRAIVYYLPPRAKWSSYKSIPSEESNKINKIWEERLLKCKGILRKIIGDRVRSRHVPDLEFRLDEVDERIDVLNEVMKDIVE
jgi:ribosome-binding factor A